MLNRCTAFRHMLPLNGSVTNETRVISFVAAAQVHYCHHDRVQSNVVGTKDSGPADIKINRNRGLAAHIGLLICRLDRTPACLPHPTDCQGQPLSQFERTNSGGSLPAASSSTKTQAAWMSRTRPASAAIVLRSTMGPTTSTSAPCRRMSITISRSSAYGISSR